MKCTKYNYNEFNDPLPSRGSSFGRVYWEYTARTKTLMLTGEDNKTRMLRRYTYCPKGNVIEHFSDIDINRYLYEYTFKNNRLVQIIRKFLLRQGPAQHGDVIFCIPREFINENTK